MKRPHAVVRVRGEHDPVGYGKVRPGASVLSVV